MDRVVSCIQCRCGCNTLSKDRIKELLNKKIDGFLNDNEAVAMFERFIPADSRTLQHITIVKQAKAYIQNGITREELEDFAEDLQEVLAEQLIESPNIEGDLRKVIIYYTTKIGNSKDFHNFTDNLIEKYNKFPKQ